MWTSLWVRWLRKSMPVALALLLATGARAGITLTSLSGRLSEARQDGAATSVGTQALFAGGMKGDGSGLSGVDIYDDSTNTWSTASLSQERFEMGATSVGTKALFAGGGLDLMPPIASDRVDIYDSASDSWSTASLSSARARLAATSLADQALFAGGTSGFTRSDRVDIYEGGVWSTATLSEARAFLAATTVGSQAFFAGGSGDSGSSDVVDIYEGGAWSTASLSEGRSSLAAATAGGVALFGGGTIESGNYSAAVDIYDPATGLWTAASLSQARGQLAATGVGDFAFFGGGTAAYESSDVVDIYHVPSDTWYTAALSAARMNLMATSVGNQAIFAGGAPSGQCVDIFEVTDTTSWTRSAASGAGDWTDKANWDSVIGPLAWDHVYIANGGTAQLAGDAQGASVTVGGGGGAGTLELLAGANPNVSTINVESQGVLNVHQDWTYDGALRISGGDANLGAHQLCIDAGGSLEITGSSLGVDRLVIGDAGSAGATQSAGTTTTGSGLQIGAQETGAGSYELSGDASVLLDVGSNTLVGVHGSGRFIQTGGVHSVGGELRMGRYGGSGGTYELSGGELAVTSFSMLGWGGEATVQQSGGTYTAVGRIYIGYRAAAVAAYELGGTGLLSATAGEHIGYEGTGAFTQTGGTHEVTGNLFLGYASGGSGIYRMQGGTLEVSDTLRVGHDGTGLLELLGGDVTVEDLNIGAAGTLMFTGGSLSVGSLMNDGILNWFGGTLNVTGAGGLALGPAEPLGAVLMLNASQALNVTGQMTVPLGATLTVGPGAEFSAETLSNAGTTMLLGPDVTLGVGGASNSDTLSVFASAVDFGGGLTNTGDAVFVGTTVTGPVHTSTGSTVTILETVTFNDLVTGGGSFWGPGTAVFNGGHSPGDSPGITTFEGNVVFGATNQLTIELAGPDNSDPLDLRYDALDVAGDVHLGGALSLVWLAIDGDPNSKFGGIYSILSWGGSRMGVFDTIDCQMAAYLDTSLFADGIEYDDANGEIKVHLYDLLDGDADLDGAVGRDDFHALQFGFGSTEADWLGGDFNLDGRVDFLDYLTWKAHVGDAVPGAGVPEPSCAVLVLLGSVAALRRRRRKRNGGVGGACVAMRSRR